MRLIVTRPEPEATRTAQALIRLGHEAILSPMLNIVIDAQAPIPDGAFQAVAVTSSNAVRALAARTDTAVPPASPLYAVGDHTALEAKRLGFGSVRSAGGTLGDLLALLADELAADAGPLLYATGRDQSGDLAGAMRARGFDVETAILYRAEPAETLTGVARDTLRADCADGVLLYSARSAEAFARAAQVAALAPLSERTTLFCISNSAAAPVSGLTRGRVIVAAEPNQISLFAAVEAEAAHAPVRS